MKAVTMDLQQSLKRSRVNRRHAESLLSSRHARFKFALDTPDKIDAAVSSLTSQITNLGHVKSARLVKEAKDWKQLDELIGREMTIVTA